MERVKFAFTHRWSRVRGRGRQNRKNRRRGATLTRLGNWNRIETLRARNYARVLLLWVYPCSTARIMEPITRPTGWTLSIQIPRGSLVSKRVVRNDRVRISFFLCRFSMIFLAENVAFLCLFLYFKINIRI